MNKKLKPIILLIIIVLVGANPIFADPSIKTPLQQAVDLIFKNPKLAEQKLIAIKDSSAKSFLAYIYMTHKVVVANSSQQIDRLMNEAIAEAPNKLALGN